MTKTRAVKWWVFRHKMYHLYYAFRYGHWRLVWNTKPWWIDFKVVEQKPDDFRGVPQHDWSQYEED